MAYKPSVSDRFWKTVSAPFKDQKDLALDFEYAAMTNKLWRAEYLLKEKGVNIASSDHFALRWAANGGHDEMIRLLMRHGGTDVNAKNGDALIRAVTQNKPAVVDVLLEYGADIAQQEFKALHLAHEKNNIVVLSQLISSGQDLRAPVAHLHADAEKQDDGSHAAAARLKLYSDYLAQRFNPKPPAAGRGPGF